MKKLIALLLLMCMVMGGCGTVQQGSESDHTGLSGASETASQSGVVSETVSQSGPSAVYSLGLDYTSTGVVNPLTGQSNLPAELSGKRSVGVIINNFRTAVPHNGISKADLVYEAEAEGGITRLLAVYSDWASVPKIGSIREARPYFWISRSRWTPSCFITARTNSPTTPFRSVNIPASTPSVIRR